MTRARALLILTNPQAIKSGDYHPCEVFAAYWVLESKKTTAANAINDIRADLHEILNA